MPTIGLSVFLIGVALMVGVQWAADCRDASVRYVARTRWGFAVYALGGILVGIAMVGLG